MATKPKRPRHKSRRRGPGRRLLGSRRRHAPGAAPGLIREGRDDAAVGLRVFAYGPQALEERQLANVDDLLALGSEATVVWVDLHGLENTSALAKVAKHYGLHPLLIEDVLNTGQRPKFEVYGDCQFCVLRLVDDAQLGQFEQISVVRRGNVVLTFQERAGDCFNLLRERLRGGTGRIRTRDAAYLVYALVDAVVDHYFPVVEALADQLVGTEHAIIDNPDAAEISSIYAYRAQCASLQRIVRPLRDTVSGLALESARTGDQDLAPYLRDVHDHTVELLDMVDACRDAAAGLMDLYLSAQGQRMNEIMKVLTIIATIFIPLSFVAGVYGMNFEGMPELHWKYGYPLVVLTMVSAAGGMLYFFRRRGWLGGTEAKLKSRADDADQGDSASDADGLSA